MNQADLLQLAKQGDPQAIATLLNHALQPRGVTTKTALVGDCLKILIEAFAAPDQTAVLDFIQNGLTNLAPAKITRVSLYGKQTGQEMPLWEESFDLKPLGDLPTLSIEEQVEAFAIAPKAKVMYSSSSSESNFLTSRPLQLIGVTIGSVLALLVASVGLFHLLGGIPSPVERAINDPVENFVR
jgi:hypothetical protein